MPIEIYPGLWLGNRKDSTNINFIKKKKINCIINITKTLEHSSKVGIEKIRIPITEPDNKYYSKNNIDMYDYLSDVTEFIHKKIQNFENVLVHCYDGIQRAPTVVAAFIIRYGDVVPNKSIQYIKSKYMDVFGEKCYYYYALRKFYDYLNNK